MALIATETPRTSNLIKEEYAPWSGYCRTALANLTPPTGGWKLGMVLDNAGALLLKANTANASYVVVDPNLSSYSTTAATPFLLVMESGPAILAQQSLIFGSDITSANDIAAVLAVLKAKGIKTANQL